MKEDAEPPAVVAADDEKEAIATETAAKPGPLIPKTGERALVAGQTGSGKTMLMAWLTERLEDSPAIIMDTKEEMKYSTLPYSVTVETQNDVNAAIDSGEYDYIIFRPPVRFLADPALLDELLYYHYENYRGLPIVIDELYSWHIRRMAGPGLIALLTRGRSRGITTLMGTQRPSGFDRFAITESQRVYAFRFSDYQDRKRLGDVIPNFEDLDLPPKFGFYFYEVGADNPILYAPIPIEQDVDPGYTDLPAEHATEPGAGEVAARRAAFF